MHCAHLKIQLLAMGHCRIGIGYEIICVFLGKLSPNRMDFSDDRITPN